MIRIKREDARKKEKDGRGDEIERELELEGVLKCMK